MNNALLPCKERVVKTKSSNLPKYFSMFLLVSLRCSPLRDSITPASSFQKFTSTFRLIVVSLFPPVIYMFLISDFPNAIKYSFSGSFVIIGIVVAIVEIANYYKRVAYDSYHYFDVNQQTEVFANALFEPLVYNESFTQVAEYQIKVPLDKFQKYFEEILVYANYFKFIITAYAYKRNTVYLYADFHEKNAKRAEKFKSNLESKFKTTATLNLQHDPNKEIYENGLTDEMIDKLLSLATTENILELYGEENLRINGRQYYNDGEHRFLDENDEITKFINKIRE